MKLDCEPMICTGELMVPVYSSDELAPDRSEAVIVKSNDRPNSGCPKSCCCSESARSAAIRCHEK